ncbi:hypothetical protein EDD79_101923 [Serpentinicella alkaliphila]|uniref:Calcineurin-like phosphoesterase domain-containing protein n=1 Tax=Serpentinicella alkaliphila TaxID=1734049 RepID=A0A4R2TET8_9FIRM|nr:hypothetical protein EDD79_101923 [Serpentinicella alkaliphila]
MGRWIIIFFLLIISIYFLLHYYIGKKGLSILNFNKCSKNIYWFFIYFLGFSFFLGRIGNEYIPWNISTLLTVIGAYWIGLIVYLWILFIAKDIVNLFVRTIFGRHNIIEENKKLINLTIIILSVILVAYGAINAKRPRIVEYSIDINKKVENIDQMKVVLISDLHIGQIVGNRFLRNIVNIVNSLEPDLILIPGDIIDDNLHENIQVKIGDILKDLNSTYGVYASLGNHEFIGGQADEIEEYLNSVNINVLRDEALKVADSFYIIGREDKASERFTNIHRRELSDIMLEIDRLNPIFMLDHQPIDIVMARDEGVDLQVSGHTHRGQILPGRFFTKRIFDVDWGLYKESSYHLIVTSGAGTWGPPIRIGTNSEVVLININFN